MSDQTPHTPARRAHREAVREKAAQVQARQRRNRWIRIGVAGLTVAAIIAVVSVVLVRTIVDRANQPEAKPTGLTDDAVVIQTLPESVLAAFAPNGTAPTPSVTDPAAAATPDATADATPTAAVQPVKIDIYVDYMAETSADFQAGNAQNLTDWVSRGTAEIAYHPVALLTSKSNGTKYSLRAATAAVCVATLEPDTFFTFTHQLLAQRPEVDTDGHTDDQLAALAIAANAEEPKKIRACIEDQRFQSWVQEATSRALSTDIGETGEPLVGPVVLVNGQPYLGDPKNAKEFAQFVFTLASGAYFSTATPTPVPSATPAVTETPAAPADPAATEAPVEAPAE